MLTKVLADMQQLADFLLEYMEAYLFSISTSWGPTCFRKVPLQGG